MIKGFNQSISDYLGQNLDDKSTLKKLGLQSIYIDPAHMDFLDIKFNYRNWLTKERVEKEVLLFKMKTDYTLAFYPLSLYVTNKMANTFISRQSQGSISNNLSLIRNCSPQGLLLGFLPYAIYNISSQVNWYSYKRKSNIDDVLQPVVTKRDKVISSILNASQSAQILPTFFLGTNSQSFSQKCAKAMNEFVTQMQLNLSTLLFIRMQNVDYKNNTSLIATIKDIRKLDGSISRAAFKGLVPFFAARKILENATQQIDHIDESYLSRNYWPAFFALGTLLAHPLFMIGVRTQSSPLEKSQELRLAQRNSLRTAIYLANTKQLYKGFIPALGLYAVMCYPQLKRRITTSWFSKEHNEEEKTMDRSPLC